MTYRLLTSVFVAWLALCPVADTASAQQADDPAERAVVDSTQAERLAELTKIYGVVSFYHPDLPEKQAAWDSAFRASAQTVATTDETSAYVDAVRDLLAALDDPATRIRPPRMGRGQAPEKQPAVRWAADSVLVARLGPETLQQRADVLKLTSEMKARLPRARGVVFDVRDPGPVPVGRFLDSQDEIMTRLSPEPYALPGTMTRMHEGFAPEGGRTSGQYASYTRTEQGKTIQPTGETNAGPVVVLAGAGDVVPQFAMALQREGRGTILREADRSNAAPIRAQVPTHRIQLQNGAVLEVRTGALQFAGGTPAGGAALTVAPSGDTTDAALDRALQIARGEAPLPEAPEASPRSLSSTPPSYETDDYPPMGTRLLAVARGWSIIEHFFPYRDLMDEPWESVLPGALRKVAAAETAADYHLALAEMMAQTDDSHVSAQSAVLDSVLGDTPAPVLVRDVENEPVVTRIVDAAVADSTGIEVGDVILSVDGTPAEVRRDSLARFRSAASTPQARAFQTAFHLLDGSSGSTATVRVRGAGGTERTVELPRGDYNLYSSPDEKPMLRRLSDRVGYADLDRLLRSDVDSVFTRFANTDAIVFDMRGYPKGTAWLIAPRLAGGSRPVGASFQKPLRLSPGDIGRQTIDFEQQIPPARGSTYDGTTVMLIDARTVSQAEHTGLFLKAANGTTFVGSATRGANGDVTRFRLPGSIRVRFTGQAVRHPDGTQLQRRGLQPDVEAAPTIESLRRGEDAVLQRAVEYVQEEIR